MKKLISMLLCLALLLCLAACGSSGQGNASTTGTPSSGEAKAFRVGYARADITPDEPTPLSGYGNTDERKHTEILDYIYLTCVAVTDAEDTTVLFFSADLCSMDDAVAAQLRTTVNNATGIPNKNIMFNSSHTHSAPTASAVSTILDAAVVEAAEEALEDRKPAQMYVGTANTSGINFVRHYYMNDDSVVTDNHGTTTGKTIVGHTTQVDEEMRILQFKREGGKDVVMANWQSHPHITGGATKTSLSADIIGAFRTELENRTDCLFAYYQGGAGNINPTSRITEENANSAKDWKVHGQLLADTAEEALSNMTQIETGPIQLVSEIYTCNTNQEDLGLAALAAEVISYYNEGHTIGETKTFAETLGIASLYHARAISNRAGLGKTYEIEINAISFGEFGWALAPYEMFDASAKYIRENSPFTFTFVSGYSNGANGYFPTLECWEYGSYESDTTKVARGTAEAVADRLVEMLTEAHGE